MTIPKTWIRIWAGQPFKSSRKNVKLGTLHPITGKPVTIEDDVDEIIGALKDKGIKDPKSLSPSEKADFIAYYEMMNALPKGHPLPNPEYKRTKQDMETAYNILKNIKTTENKEEKKSKKK